MNQIFEFMMLICFGISWPISVFKSIKSRSTGGKSFIFTIIVMLGYVFGIISKITSDNFTYIFWLYILNFVIISIDLIVFFINKKYEKLKEL